jgi:hypothetical protein
MISGTTIRMEYGEHTHCCWERAGEIIKTAGKAGKSWYRKVVVVEHKQQY